VGNRIGENGLDPLALLGLAALDGSQPLPPTGVTAATYGDATHVAQIAIRKDGRVSSASSVAITLPALPNYTVATLPALPADGALALATDCTLTAITGLGLAPTGGGGNKVPVYAADGGWLML
jgi:hypothetical protein